MARQKPDDGLRPLFRKHLPQIHWQSIETGGVGAGVPDSNGCWKGVEFWVEYKWTAGYAVTLAPEQIGWLMARTRAGGRVYIAVRRRHDGGPRRGPPADELWVMPGAMAVEVREKGLRGLRGDPRVAGPWFGGPARWDWPAVAAYLVAKRP